MKWVFCGIAMSLLMISALHAQDISGDWQGAGGTGKERQRIILHIEKAEDGGWKATLFAIDIQPDDIPVTSITQQGSNVAFSIAGLKLSYEGTVNSDGTSIAGKMTWEGTTKITFTHPTKEIAWPRDIHCACTTSFIPVGQGVKLEVLDWGGTGRPLVLLAGLGDTAHGFDKFAAQLVPKYHVYGITRRGFGESSSPPPTAANYSADRLGDDILAVIDALHLRQRPVLVGHSIAGEELSSIGSRHADKIAGLVYLDAAYEYAFYNRAQGDVNLDAVEMRNELEKFIEAEGSDKQAVSELLQQLPKLEKELQTQQAVLANLPADPSEADGEFGPAEAIMLGQEKHTKIPCPILAIFADPNSLGPMTEYNAAGRAAMTKYMADHTTADSKAFEAGVPSAHVVRIPNADHYVFQSNEADVLREMNAFITGLPN